MTGETYRAALQKDLARWRDELEAIAPGSGFDQQRSMIASWLKEGQRLLDRIA